MLITLFNTNNTSNRPTTSSTPTQTSTTSTSPSPVSQTSHPPRRNSSSAPTHPPSLRSASPPSRPSPAQVPTTLAVSSSKSSTTPPHLKPRRSTSARQHGQTTTRSSPMSTSPLRTTHTSARTPRVLTSMAWSAHSNPHQKEALFSFTLAHTTPQALTPHKNSGSRSLPS
jgi:hypothetical protein